MAMTAAIPWSQLHPFPDLNYKKDRCQAANNGQFLYLLSSKSQWTHT